MLVESLVVSSHEFSLSFYVVLEILSKTTNILSSLFPLLRVSLYYSLFTFYFVFFHSLKHRRTINTHVNRPVKLLSLPVPVDSTC